jgi:hypothetical protein
MRCVERREINREGKGRERKGRRGERIGHG